MQAKTQPRSCEDWDIIQKVWSDYRSKVRHFQPDGAEQPASLWAVIKLTLCVMLGWYDDLAMPLLHPMLKGRGVLDEDAKPNWRMVGTVRHQRRQSLDVVGDYLTWDQVYVGRGLFNWAWCLTDNEEL